MSTLKVVGVKRLAICPHGAADLRVKIFLVHRGHGPPLSFTDVCRPGVDSEWYMKAMRARSNVGFFLELFLTSLVLAPIDHAIVGPRRYEQHTVPEHTHQPCLVLEVPIALLRGQMRSLGPRRASSSNHGRIMHHSEAPARNQLQLMGHQSEWNDVHHPSHAPTMLSHLAFPNLEE